MTGEVNLEPRGRLAWLTPREAFLNAFEFRGEALLDALGGGAIAADELGARGRPGVYSLT